MSKKNRILFVTTISNTINAFMIPHIKFLLQKGYEIDIACKQEQIINIDELSNVRIYQIPFERSPYSISNIRAYGKLRSLLHQNHYDIVHVHTPIASMITRLVCKKIKNTKVFYTAHGFHFYKGAPPLSWLLYYPVEKLLSYYTDTLITINNEDFYRSRNKFKAKRTFLVRGVGINVEDIKKNASEVERNNKSKEFLSVGELNANKNHSIVIKALSEYAKKSNNYNWKYRICGTGPLEEKIRNQIIRLDLQDNIELLGYRNDVIEKMARSDFFIFPSLREGLPVSIMEAMASGMFVIASNIRGNSDVIKNNSNGLLFESNNLLELEEIIENVMSQNFKKDMYRIKKQSRIDVMKYDIHNILLELEKIYLD